MARWTRFVPALAVALLLGGCGQGTSDTPLSPPDARFTGGATLGGNATPSPDDSATGTTSTPTPDELPPPDSTGRTGGTTLGGN